jgi:hypothetical protein
MKLMRATARAARHAALLAGAGHRDAIASGPHPNHLSPKRLLAIDLEMSWSEQARQSQIT